MKYKVGQICYMTDVFSDFLEATGLKLPLKCRVEYYNREDNSYDVHILKPSCDGKYLEMSDGNFMKVQGSYGLAGVEPKNLMGSV